MSPFDPVQYFKDSRGYFLQFGTSDRMGECKVAFEYKDKTECFGTQPCHRSVTNYSNYGAVRHGILGIYSSLWVSSSEHYEGARLYWNYLFDKDVSPWRSILQTQDGREAKIIYDAQERPIAFHLPIDGTSPSQVVGNFCIASRLPFQRYRNIELFRMCMERGLTVHEAHYMSSYCYWDNGHLRQDMGSVHFPFCPSKHLKLSTLKHARLRVNSCRFQNSEYCQGEINNIWYPAHPRPAALIPILTTDENYTGSLPGLFKNKYGRLSFGNGIVTNLDTAIELFQEHKAELE